ncbi:MAG TPA: DUF2752 domain-containing protein [Pyrinomonadaceae bacterium]|nr:DUF2752 domain-containing protein [Pyrinomonadaceae bacterium]
MALALSAIAAAQVALVSAGLPGWPCPMMHGLGVPCPGCGLSRATVALLRGDFAAALSLHAFALILPAALAVIGCAALLPEGRRLALLAGVERVERRTGVTAVLAAGLVCYWLARLIFTPEAFIRLMRG